MKLAIGALNSDHVGKKVTYQEPGIHVIGVLKSVEHELQYGKKKPETRLRIQPSAGGVMAITRPTDRTVEIEESK